MEKFEFNADWEYKVRLNTLSELQIYKENFTPDNSIKERSIILSIEDELSDEPDPKPEQIKAINYIFENQESILNSIINKALNELPQIILNYELENNDKYKNINTKSIKELININRIEIKIPERDSYSYFDIICNCEWDAEHGLNILMHRDRIISFSIIDGNSHWDALKDNGDFDESIKEKTEKKIPKKYKAHPKYGKLKPTQIFANETYEFNLISGNFNKLFKEGVRKNNIDKNGMCLSQGKSYLEIACSFNNLELVEFLLLENAEIRYALHQCFSNNFNVTAFELILLHGGDINSKNLSGNTVLHIVANELVVLYDHKEQSIQYGWNNIEEFDSKISLKKETVKELIIKGANPSIKNHYKFDVYELGRNLSEFAKNEYIGFINSCIEQIK